MLHVALSEPVSYHIKQKLTRTLSVFHATPISVPITDSSSEHLSAGFLQPGPGMGITPGCYEPILGHFEKKQKVN